MSTKDRCNLLWSLALLGEAERATFHRLASSLPSRFERGDMQDEGLLRQTFQAFLCSKLAESAAADDQAAAATPSSSDASTSGRKRSATIAAISFPPPMMDALKRSWVTMVQQAASRATTSPPSSPNTPPASSTPSYYDEDIDGDGSGASSSSSPSNGKRRQQRSSSWSPTKLVSEMIGGMRVRHDVARTTRDGLTIIDIALRPSEDRYVALQVLRDYDQSRNTRQMLGPVLFQRQILERNGWEVRYLLFSDLVGLEERSRPAFIADLLRHLGCRTTGGAGGGGGGASGSEGGARGGSSRGGDSEEAWEAGVAMRDPKASPGGRGGRGKGGGGR